jgi:serine/threonine protein kinase
MKLLRKLGEGGYAAVHECRDVSSGKLYACKVFEKATTTRFQVIKEAGIHRRVYQSQTSGKIAGFVNLTEDDDTFKIVMELCEGGHVACTRGGYAPWQAREIVRGTLEGLMDVHRCGIIHRDIKHANILLKDDRVKIADFGTSVYFHPSADKDTGKQDVFMTTNDIKGTPRFLSPEALRHECMFTTDVWCVGVLAYQLMTGEFPFEDTGNRTNPSLNAIVRSIMEDAPAFGHGAWRAGNRDAIDFVECCLIKSPLDRPSVAECLEHPWMRDGE